MPEAAPLRHLVRFAQSDVDSAAGRAVRPLLQRPGALKPGEQNVELVGIHAKGVGKFLLVENQILTAAALPAQQSEQGSGLPEELRYAGVGQMTSAPRDVPAAVEQHALA